MIESSVNNQRVDLGCAYMWYRPVDPSTQGSHRPAVVLEVREKSATDECTTQLAKLSNGRSEELTAALYFFVCNMKRKIVLLTHALIDWACP